MWQYHNTVHSSSAIAACDSHVKLGGFIRRKFALAQLIVIHRCSSPTFDLLMPILCNKKALVVIHQRGIVNSRRIIVMYFMRQMTVEYSVETFGDLEEIIF